MKTIGIVVCYMGEFPEWFPLWLKSCGNNSTIDFILVADHKVIYDIPENVHIIESDLGQLRNLFSKVLGFPCALDEPYKLCDYKPLYGIGFQDILKDYDFWGHCDIDMIFGNLRKFITDEILNSYDRIFEVGHLSLYRNNETINNAYQLSGGMLDYKKVFMEKHCCGFDEHTGITRIFNIAEISTYNDVVCADIDPHYRSFYMMDEDSVQGKMKVKNVTHQVFGIIDNATYQIAVNESNNEIELHEVSYIHFMRKYPKNAAEVVHSANYLITYKEFLSIDKENLSVDMVYCYDYHLSEIKKKIEYLREFIMNAWRAYKKGELLLRVKLRFQRIKMINRKCEEQNR